MICNWTSAESLLVPNDLSVMQFPEELNVKCNAMAITGFNAVD